MMVGAFFVLAAGAGLVRNIVIAHQFGIGADLDVYYAAFKLPELLFTVVAGGALATAFIPVLAGFLAENDLEGAWRLGSTVTNLVVLVVSGLAVIAALLAPWLVRTLIAPGFGEENQAETVVIMRLALISTLLFGISAVQSSMLHGFKHFLLPAIAPVVYPLAVAAGALWLAPTWGIRGIAAGAIVGAALHLAVKIPGLLHYGFRWWPVLDLKSPTVRRVLALMGPRVLDLGVFHLTLLATANLASRLGAGSLSALEWGWDFMQLPETVIGTAFGLVALPTLSDLAARGDIAGLRNMLGETVRAVMALTVPAACGLILLGRPLLQVLYQRGAFDANATDAVFVALRFYALGLVGHASLELAARAFFAQQDTITPLLIAAASAAVNIALGIILMGPMGHGGLALANSLAISGEVLALFLILRKRWRGAQGKQILGSLGRVAVTTLLMGIAVIGVLAWSERAGVSASWVVIFGAATGMLVYVGAGLLLGVQALRWPLDAWAK
ncbi:MAG: murein biosynthesis integral membrane protein MurJ [Chloroflexi bacterium RBG_13_56_8]|nr:MAG: murein biosynthesis integral membrane protein MurJ [Chloroflexi bacterium RBG_13_56_8]